MPARIAKVTGLTPEALWIGREPAAVLRTPSRRFGLRNQVLRKNLLDESRQTPNRLWYHDGHTSKLPFYFWLPDDVALRYSQFSSRKRFNELYLKEHNGNILLNFYRWGRGVSFHEFDLSIGKVENLKVVSSLKGFLRSRDRLWWYKKRSSNEYHFGSFLKKYGPKIHEGFYESYLNLIIERD